MKRALIGFGGHAQEALAQIGEKLACFVDDQYVVEGTFAISSFDPAQYEVLVAVADPKHRCNIVERLPKTTKYFTFIHNTALIMGDVKIGEGSFIGAYSIVTTNIKLGKHALLNRSNHIGHDCQIGDYLSMMPGSIVSGNCNIGNLVYMGTNCSVREKISICDGVTIGLNGGVVKNIIESGVYVGTPCKKL
jgi:sugar O-acyltransferase (sialic acid O-acetyltransferase NeuD family)